MKTKFKPITATNNRADIDTLSGAIIFNQIALNYNERLKHTKYYSQEIKRGINLLLPALIKKEAAEFDKVWEHDVDMVSAVSDNVQRGMSMILEKPFSELTIITQLIQAYNLDKEKIEAAMVEVLKEHLK